MITTNGRSIGTVELTTNLDLSAYQQSSTNRMKTNSVFLRNGIPRVSQIPEEVIL